MLYIVPTPLGNLEDITIRAIKILGQVDAVVAEDTRKSSILLKHYSISKPLLSFHKFNEHRIVTMLVEQMAKGKTLALISDAGTPGISDPGFLLVREAILMGIDVITLPGPTALIPAVVSSGLPCDKFVFEGFLPQKKGRHKLAETLKDEHRTLIFYESPNRLLRSLELFKEYFGGERKAAVCREISKIHEEIKRGSISELISYYADNQPRGEVVLVIEGKQ